MRAKTGIQVARRANREAAQAPKTAPASVHQAIGTPGSALDPATRVDAERRFGHDFSKVQVHATGQAAASADDVGADAYTVGSHVVFGEGQYQPRTPQGHALMMHELTHTVQQQDAGISGSIPMGTLDAPAEAEAARIERGAGSVRARDGATLRRQPKKPAASVFDLDPATVPAKAPEKKDFVWTRLANPTDHETRLSKWKAGDAAAFDGAYEAMLNFTSTSFVGVNVPDIHPDVKPIIDKADAEMKSLNIDNAKLRKRGFGINGIGGARSKGNASYHALGLAIDIDSNKNPYIRGESGEKEIDAETGPVYDRIAKFIVGQDSVVTGKSGIRSGASPGGASRRDDMYNQLFKESEGMRTYFTLMSDADSIKAYLQGNLDAEATDSIAKLPDTPARPGYQKTTMGTDEEGAATPVTTAEVPVSIREGGITERVKEAFGFALDPKDLDGAAKKIQAVMVGDWTKLTSADPDIKNAKFDEKDVDRSKAKTSAPGAGGKDKPFETATTASKHTRDKGRDPTEGFLNLDYNVVQALTNAGLAWGAIDLGEESGDIMHFDMRRQSKWSDGKRMDAIGKYGKLVSELAAAKKAKP